MRFLWPDMLWLLLAIPLLVAGYIYILRRRKRSAIRYSSLLLVREAVRGQRLRRHVPPALFLIAMAAAIVAIARPTASVGRSRSRWSERPRRRRAERRRAPLSAASTPRS